MYEPTFMFVQLQLSILYAPVEPVNLPVFGHIGQYLIPKSIGRICPVISQYISIGQRCGVPDI